MTVDLVTLQERRRCLAILKLQRCIDVREIITAGISNGDMPADVARRIDQALRFDDRMRPLVNVTKPARAR